MQTGSCMNRRGYKVRANLRPAIFLLHWPTVRWGGRQILTQFANFGALALATTGQHERWPDYAVSVHNWHLEYAKFSILHECKKFSNFTFTLLPVLYGEALTHCLFFHRLFKQGRRSTFQPNQHGVSQIHEKVNDKLYVQSMIAKDNITRSQNLVNKYQITSKPVQTVVMFSFIYTYYVIGLGTQSINYNHCRVMLKRYNLDWPILWRSHNFEVPAL